MTNHLRDQSAQVRLRNGNDGREADFVPSALPRVYDLHPWFLIQPTEMTNQQAFTTLWYCEKLTWSFAVREYAATPLPKRVIHLSGPRDDGASQSLDMPIETLYRFLGSLEWARDVVAQRRFSRLGQGNAIHGQQVAADRSYAITITDEQEENDSTSFAINILRRANGESPLLTLGVDELFEFMSDAQEARRALSRCAGNVRQGPATRPTPPLQPVSDLQQRTPSRHPCI